MIYPNDKINVDLLKVHIQKLGLTEGQFCKQLWNNKSHYSIRYFEERSVGLPLLIKTCNLLGIHLDDLFFSRNQDGDTPFIYGNNNIQNSTVILNDIASLKAENKSQKEMIDMLKKENADLGRRLDNVIDLIRKSDSIK